MSGTDIAELERFVAENDALWELEERVGRFNVFDALRVSRQEIRHSNFLAWLLTPTESHGQGDSFVRPLLMDIVRQGRLNGFSVPLSAIALDGAPLQGLTVRREWNNIDLLITAEKPRFVLAVENKVDSVESEGQLKRYRERVSAAFGDSPSLLVYLTKDGEPPSDPSWMPYSYSDIHRVLKKTRRLSGAREGEVAVFLDHYLNLLETLAMSDPDLDALCRTIYRNHRRAIDVLFDRLNLGGHPVLRVAAELLKAQPDQWSVLSDTPRWVAFVPVELRGILPAIGGRARWDSRDWLIPNFHVADSGSAVEFRCWTTETTDSTVRDRAVNRLATIEPDVGFRLIGKKQTRPAKSWVLVCKETVVPESDGEIDSEAITDIMRAKIAEVATRFERIIPALRNEFCGI